MKQRFSALDVSGIVTSLRPTIQNQRLQNVYDISPRTYLFKFSSTVADSKELLLVESGIRIHSSEFSREKSMFPSPFCIKLRKHLKGRRLKDIQQVRADRIIDLTFGEGDGAYHLMLEFYASGNIILCDHQYKILSLLRVVQVQGVTPAVASNSESVVPSNKVDSAKFAVGETYRLDLATDFHPATEDRVRLALEGPPPESEPMSIPSESLQSTQHDTSKKRKGGKKSAAAPKAKKKKDWTLRKVIRDAFAADYGTALIDHLLSISGLDGALRVPDDIDASPKSPHIASLMSAFDEANTIVQSCIERPQKGYIILSSIAKDLTTDTSADNSGTARESDTSTNVYDEFHPYLFAQHNGRPHLEFESFNIATDTFFSRIEAQKLELRARQAELNAQKRIETVKAGHESQIKGLASQQEESTKVARAMELNMCDIDSLLQTLRTLLASGMDWQDLNKLVKDETIKGNKIASMIVALKMESSTVSISLRDPDDTGIDDVHSPSEDDAQTDDSATESDESDDEDGSIPSSVTNKPNNETLGRMLIADIDIYASAFSNARKYYDVKKSAAMKQEKTQEAAEKAVKSAERKILQELKTAQKQVPSMTKVRKPYWFEKFLWFVSSENYLVVGGHDAQQNEQLVRKYLKRGDVYIHADLSGASSVVVKNPNPNAAPPPDVSLEDWSPIPPDTLLQAGTMSVCQSKAWEAKVVTSAWWVHPDQVSKTAPTGEYLTTGSFMVRGKKHWLPPVQLVYGYGLLFRVSDEDIQRHYWERRPWGRNSDQVPNRDINNSISAMSSRAQSLETIGISPMGSTANFADDESPDVIQAAAEESGGGTDSDSDWMPEARARSCIRTGSSNPPLPAIVVPVGSDDTSVGEMGDSEGEQDVDESPPQSPCKSRSKLQRDDTVPVADKYNLNEIGDEAVHDPSPVLASITASASSAPGRKRAISAKERRDMKKKRAGKGNDSWGDDESNKTSSVALDTLDLSKLPHGTTSKKPPMAPPSNQQQAHVRGKKGKLKKQKTKYRDQDDEDKQLALEVLGSAKGQQQQQDKKGKGGRSEFTKEPSVRIRLLQPDSARVAGVIQEKDGNESSKSSNNGDATHNADESAKQDEEGNAQPQAEEADDEQKLEEDVSMNYLDSLTGNPHEDDTVLFAMPVCAPFSALIKYKFRVKLVPGSLKKGKAAKSALEAFVKMATPVEKELIRRIPETESVQTMMAKCKLMGIDGVSGDKGGKSKGLKAKK
ncbi:hypothetical protein SeMB42_g03741 [Synchytrium endobioticum]|uniref:Ribosome quality control complex subunit 2 n=1 Tax=Synchytrium endobioticum TaxID=286115 RepID=A0A507D509_9FUNG|nr:hypothetical protein SeMB42_g03741 [Synchytrium endobioticum]